MSSQNFPNWSFSWSIKNLFYRSISYIVRLTYFSKNRVRNNWILSWILNIPQYSTDNFNPMIIPSSEVWKTSQHPIHIINSQRHDDHHSKSYCVNHHYYPCLIGFFNYCFFNVSICRLNIQLLRNITDKSWYFPDLIVLTSPHERSADTLPIIFKFTLQDAKPRTLVDVKDCFWCHKWLLLSRIYLILQIN